MGMTAMGSTAGIGFVVVSLVALGTPGLASGQSTPDPAVKKLIETRLGEFAELTKQVDAAGDDQAKLADLATKIAAAVERTYADYEELNTSWNADQKQLVITFGRDAGNDVMQRLVAAAQKANAAVKDPGTSGCTECVALVLVPGCQVRCCKGDRSPVGSNVALNPWQCPPIEQKTCSEMRPGCPQ